MNRRNLRHVAAAVLVLSASQALANGGHDHGDAQALPGSALPRMEAVSPDLELVAVAKGRRLEIYLDRFATNEPIDGATIEVEADGSMVTATFESDGIYTLEADWVAAPGTRNLMFTISAPDVADLLIGTLEIPAPPTVAAAPPALGWGELIRLSAAWQLATAAFALGFVFAFAFRPPRVRRDEAALASAPPTEADELVIPDLGRAAEVLVLAVVATAMAMPALAHGDEVHGEEPAAAAAAAVAVAIDAPRRLLDGTLFVPKVTQRLVRVRTVLTATSESARSIELLGTVLPSPNSGGKVQPLLAGRIEPPEGGLPHIGQTVTKGQLLATVVPSVDVVARGNVEAQIAELSGAIALAEQRVARLRQLEGSVPQKEIEEARAGLEALRKRRAAVQPILAQREALRAPVSGVVSVANVQAGQVVDAHEVLFEIVDPLQLWVEAMAFDPETVDEIANAFGLTREGDLVPLAFIGRGLSLKQQAIPLQFKIAHPRASLSVGEPVTVVIQSAKRIVGIALPQSSIVRAANGQPIVWEHSSAERFVPIPVRFEPLDGVNLLVTAGVEPGIRIVIEGAELLNQVR